MFVQVIVGRTSQPDALRARFEEWDRSLKPGASGFGGSVAGVTDDGRFVAVVGFDSEQAARTNNDRSEQGEWWEGTAGLLDGEPTFDDTTEVDRWLTGLTPEAGFVQVMRGRLTDATAARRLNDAFGERVRELRPDIVGAVTAWHGDRFTEAVLFRDEASAREQEASDRPPEAGELLEEFDRVFTDIEYFDLRDPWHG